MDSFQMSWKTVKGYAFPPFCLIGRCYRRSGGRKQLNVDSTSLTSSDVVFDVTLTLNSGTGFVAANKEVATESEGRTPSVGPANDLEIGGMESVRQRATKEGFSEESTDSLMANWREGTKVSYQSAWGKWSSWCRGRGINPFQAAIPNIVKFLSTMHREGRQYSTINGYRSAISAIHPHIDRCPVGEIRM